MILVVEPLLSLFLKVKDYSIKDLMVKIKMELVKKDLPLERVIYLRKYSGKNQLKGILDYIPENSQILDFKSMKNNATINESNVILGPLNMEELSLY